MAVISAATIRDSISLGKFSLYNHFLVISYVIYKALCFDVAQGRMNGAPNETRTHPCRSASLAC